MYQEKQYSQRLCCYSCLLLKQDTAQHSTRHILWQWRLLNKLLTQWIQSKAYIETPPNFIVIWNLCLDIINRSAGIDHNIASNNRLERRSNNGHKQFDTENGTRLINFKWCKGRGFESHPSLLRRKLCSCIVLLLSQILEHVMVFEKGVKQMNSGGPRTHDQASSNILREAFCHHNL